MAEMKTKRNRKSVTKFLDALEHPTRREDAYTILAIMQELSGEKPSVWGDSIIGFGNFHYRYATGREGDMPKIGFSPRKASFSIYLSHCQRPDEKYLKKLGKCRMAKSCLYINKLSDVDLSVFREMVHAALDAPDEYRA